MPHLPFFWIDAFTKNKLGGNPCAVILNADQLSKETMQAIAKEMNLSETAFVMKSETADFKARYFTPVEELPFAGHPTIAVIHALIQAGMIQTKKEITQISLELPAGIIPVEILNNANELKIVMSQLAPKFLRTYDRQDICSIFGLRVEDLLPDVPIQTVSTGTPILMIPLANHHALKKIEYVDVSRYLKLKESGDFFYAHHFALQGATPKGLTFARSLPTPPSTLEDPFTGSSTGCMAAYLWKHRLIANPCFVAEQGHWMGRPGEAEVQIIGDPDTIQTIRVAGTAVTIITGTLTL